MSCRRPAGAPESGGRGQGLATQLRRPPKTRPQRRCNFEGEGTRLGDLRFAESEVASGAACFGVGCGGRSGAVGFPPRVVIHMTVIRSISGGVAFPHPSHTYRGNCGLEWIGPALQARIVPANVGVVG